MMITTIAMAALALGPAPADTPTEEITEAIVEAVIATPEGAAVCDAYGSIRDAVNTLVVSTSLDATTSEMLVDMVDSYILVHQIENEDLRLTPEARLAFLGYLHDNCV